MTDHPADVSVTMVRGHLDDIPHYPLAQGFTIRAMLPHESPLWLDVQRDAEKIIPIDASLWEREFGFDPVAVAERCFLVFDPNATTAVGTISAWFGEIDGLDHGRIHWVAVRPAFQGRGLSKAMMSYAMTQLARWHQRAYLRTSTTRLPAIKVYLDFGFIPLVRDEEDRRAWNTVRGTLNHPALLRDLQRGPTLPSQ